MSPRRIEHPNHARFLTFSCHDRLPLLSNAAIADLLAARIARERDRLGFSLLGWVIMPEHVHLLIWPRREHAEVPRVLQAIKQPFAATVMSRWRELDAPILRRLTPPGGRPRFWLRGGGFDRNIFTPAELRQKLEYIHRNPIERGLVERPEHWRWSSARWYAGMRDGEISMDPARKP